MSEMMPRPPRIIAISGKIAAGKTTLAKSLEAKGFTYTRFSLVIDDLLRAQGRVLNRASRQEEGLRIHKELGQQWLVGRVIQSVAHSSKVVIDGLRFPEDHTHLVRHYGDNMQHIFVHASDHVRRARYSAAEQDIPFDVADAQEVEASIEKVAALASKVIVNEGSVEDLRKAVDDELAIK